MMGINTTRKTTHPKRLLGKLALVEVRGCSGED